MLGHLESTTVDNVHRPSVSFAALLRSLLILVHTVLAYDAAWAQSSLPMDTASVQLFAKGPHSRVALRLPEIFHETKSDAINVEFQIDKDWHIYWENPGDSGEEPKFNFSASRGVSFGQPRFPIPKRIAAGPFTNFGFESSPGEPLTIRPVTIRIPAKVIAGGESGLAEVNLDLTYLVCKEECIPAEVKLRGRVPVRKTEESAAVHVPYRPQDFPPLSGKGSREEPLSSEWKINKEGRLVFSLKEFGTLDLRHADQLSKLEFFPLANFSARHSERGRFETVKGSSAPELLVTLDIDPGLNPPAVGTTLEGLIVDRESGLANWVQLRSDSSFDWLGLLRYMSFAFLGGFFLNLMPCVFPVVSLKVLSFVRESAGDRRETTLHALLYALGVLVSLWLLLAVLLALRSVGTAVGWGFQLQNPIFLLALFAVFLFLGFNLLGLFEINYSGPGRLQNLMMMRGRAGSFFTGLLTTIVATPCSAPFMGVAIGAALASGYVEASLVFTMLGFGLASPYVVLGFFPKLVERLPRPGAWMDRFKQILAFPLFLTAVWLLWVLSQIGATAAIVLIMGWTVMVGFYVWARHFQLSKTKWLALIIVVIGFLLVAKVLEETPESRLTGVQEISRWEPYSDEAVKVAIAKGESVFIDYTASWCVTCQVNKKLVLDTARGQAIFQSAGVRLIRADWTKRDSEISNSLSRLGRQSVPVYAYYRSGSSNPELLPEILTYEILENALRK